MQKDQSIKLLNKDEYKRIWNEYLEQERKAFNLKWYFKTQLNSVINDVSEFDVKKTLGSGSFGTVVLIKHKKTEKHYALKILKKKEVIKLRQVEHTINEKKIISSIDFPFIVSFFGSFKDSLNLYLVLEYVEAGEMFKYLTKLGRFTEKLCKFYAAQVILALEYLHSLDIIHRDIKPENIMISKDGYLKVTDFGFAKLVTTRTYTMCGTPEYLAPEIIAHKGYSKSVDWWTLGILVYEMNAGYPPFQCKDTIKLFKKIVVGSFKMLTIFSDELKDFLNCIIKTNITKRYGCMKNGVNDIKMHKWLSSVNWYDIFRKNIKPPLIPIPKSLSDTCLTKSNENAEESTDRYKIEDHFADF